MNRVLITGANGFVGRHLCQALLETGWAVRGACRQKGGLIAGVEPVIIDEIGPETDWRKALKDVRHVVHLAAKVHEMDNTGRDGDSYERVNAEGTRALAEAAVKQGIKRIILASSIKAMAEETPRNLPLTEKSGFQPGDAYGRSKLEAERCLARACVGSDTKWLILRLPLVYGPGVKANMLRLMHLVDKEIPLPFGLIRNQRSFISIENLTDLVIKGLTHPDAENEFFLVSDNRDLATPELIQLIARAMGRRTVLLPMPVFMLRLLGKLGDAAAKVTGRRTGLSSSTIARLTGSLAVDPSHCMETLGWQPPLTVEKGITEMVRCYLETKGMG